MDDEWQVSLIWQYVQDGNLLRFLNDESSEMKQASGTGYILPFRVKVNGAKGNAVVGLYRKGVEPTAGNFLWSWHIWVTDYNPDALTESAQAGKYVYAVPGGEVHRYTGAEWEIGMYKDAFIMDRNLGALKTTWGGLDNDLEGLIYYQYGHKDPLPSSATSYEYYDSGTSNNTYADLTPVTLYDIDGNPLYMDNPNNAASTTHADIVYKNTNIPGPDFGKCS